MSIKISFLSKNASSVLMLLGIFLIGTGFMTVNDGNTSERKKRKRIIKTAQKYLGTKYKSGGKNPRGFDCSGFTYFVMKENNIQLGASSRQQALQGEPVKIKKLEPGDLIYFGSKKRVNHIGIVTESKRSSLKMIHASSSRGIIEEDVYKSSYWMKRMIGGRRVL